MLDQELGFVFYRHIPAAVAFWHISLGFQAFSWADGVLIESFFVLSTIRRLQREPGLFISFCATEKGEKDLPGLYMGV